jgi:predicted NACHT family NTPase
LFKQKVAEQYIIEYIRNLPDANTDLEELQLDSEKLLRTIEAQCGLLVERSKGIYSFAHLIFHEYFPAREIVFGKHSSQEVLQNIVSHITDKRWREVFFLATEMSLSADQILLLMKQQVDTIVARNRKMQQFLMWVYQKSVSVKVPDKPVGVRAFYFEYAIADYLAYDLSFFILADYLGFNSISIPTIALEIDLTPTVNFNLAFARYDVVELNLCIDYALGYDLEPMLKQALQQLRTQLPDSNGKKEILDQWWKANRLTCAEQLRDVMIKYRNIGHDWQFSDQQKELLKQYRDANKLLVECLNSDCYVSREVRQEIEDTLLLPIAEIEKRKHGQ